MNVQGTQAEPQSTASTQESISPSVQMATNAQEIYPHNAFDDYSVNNASNHSETRASPVGSLSGLKNTVPASSAMSMAIPNTFDRATTASPVGTMLGQHHDMFRTSTEPTRMSNNWQHSNTNQFTQSSLNAYSQQQQRRQTNHTELNHFTTQQQAQNQLGYRPRAKTAATCTSWNAQNPAYRASGLRNETSMDTFYSHIPVDVKPEVEARVSHAEPLGGEDPLKFLYESPSSENSDANSMTAAFTGASHAGSNLASYAAMNYKTYTDNTQQFTYNTSPGIMNYSGNSHQYAQQMLQHMAGPMVPLRSQSLSLLDNHTPRAPTVASNSPTVLAKPRRRSRYSKQYSEDMDDDIDVIMEDDDDASGCHYASIEAARAAERPPVKVKPEKDKTIPTSSAKRQDYVRQMVRCMVFTGKAQDNQGMIQQWRKMKQDVPRVEQAAWRMLEMVLQMHEHGIPMLASKAPSNRYANMKERWDAICRGLMTQKTMCKHLLGSEFSSQLVNDPITATQRVQNNRKVNAGKKNFIDKGRLALTGNGSPDVEKDQSRRRRGESSSTLAKYEDEGEDEDDIFNRLIDNNNNVDDFEEEPTVQFHTSTGYPAELSTSHGNFSKRQMDSEDSSQSPFEPGPSSKKAKIKPLPRKVSTKSKPDRLSRSIYQMINDRMIDITDPKHAEEVQEVCKEGTQFSRHIQSILDRQITRRKAVAAVPPGAYRIGDEADGDDEHSALQEESEVGHPYSAGRRRRY